MPSGTELWRRTRAHSGPPVDGYGGAPAQRLNEAASTERNYSPASPQILPADDTPGAEMYRMLRTALRIGLVFAVLAGIGGIRLKRASVTLALVLLTLAALTLCGCGPAVPDVKGMTPSQAAQALRSAGFDVGRIDYAEGALGAQGAVIAQTPRAGDHAQRGSLAILTVAGPPPVPAPNVIGLDTDRAQAALTAAGLVLGATRSSFSATAPAGSVTSQTPAAETTVPRGSRVNVVLSKGPQPIPVPSVNGRPQAEAVALLQQAGFKVKFGVPAFSSVKAGNVFKQAPATGSAPRGSVVTITISKGAAPSVNSSRPNGGSAAANHKSGGSISCQRDSSKVIWLNKGKFSYSYSFSGETDYQGWTYQTSVYISNAATDDVVRELMSNGADGPVSGSGSQFAPYTGWYTLDVVTCYPGTVKVWQ